MKTTYPIESILGTQSSIAVLRVLHNVQIPLNTSQIASYAQLTRPAVSTVLKKLEQAGIVQESSAEKANIYSMRRSNAYVKQIIEPLFDAEDRIPNELVRDITDEFSPVATHGLLFGSYAREEQTPTSDFDIILVASDAYSKKELEELVHSYSSAFKKKYGTQLSALVYGHEDLAQIEAKSPAFAQALKQDGIVLWGKNFWELGR